MDGSLFILLLPDIPTHDLTDLLANGSMKVAMDILLLSSDIPPELHFMAVLGAALVTS